MERIVESALRKAIASAFSLLKQQGAVSDKEIADIIHDMVTNLVRREQLGDTITEEDYKRIGTFLNSFPPNQASTAIYEAALAITRAYRTDAKETAMRINHLVRAAQQYEDVDAVNDMLSAIRKVLTRNYPQRELTTLILHLDTDVEEALRLGAEETTAEPVLDINEAVSKIKEIIATYEPPADISPEGWDKNLVERFREVVVDIVEQRVQGAITQEAFAEFLGMLVDAVNAIREQPAEEEREEMLEKAYMQDSSAAYDVQETKTERVRRLVQQLLREIRELEDTTAQKEIDEEEERAEDEVDVAEKRRIVAYSLVDALNLSVMAAEGDAEEKEKVKQEIEEFARQLGVPPSKVIFALANYLKMLLLKSIVERLSGGA